MQTIFRTMNLSRLYLVWLIWSSLVGCASKISFKSPDGYDFTKAENYILPASLREISGIALMQSNPNRVFAINDEEGKLYYFELTSERIPFTKFSRKGDYEDLTITKDGRIVVLKSDGSLYVFALDVLEKKEVDSVEEFSQVFPKGEYEGIAAHENSLFIVCKNCQVDNKKKQITVYETTIPTGAPPKINYTRTIDLSSVELDKQQFSPSCIAKNPISGDWYILSSTNKKLIVLNQSWSVENVYTLDPAVFRQPEGMVFGSNGNLYISTEGGDRPAAILKFVYKTLNKIN